MLLKKCKLCTKCTTDVAQNEPDKVAGVLDWLVEQCGQIASGRGADDGGGQTLKERQTFLASRILSGVSSILARSCLSGWLPIWSQAKMEVSLYIWNWNMGGHTWRNVPKQWTFPYKNGSELVVKPIPQLLRAFFLISYLGTFGPVSAQGVKHWFWRPKMRGRGYDRVWETVNRFPNQVSNKNDIIDAKNLCDVVVSN